MIMTRRLAFLVCALAIVCQASQVLAQTEKQRLDAHLLVRQAREHLRAMEPEKALPLLDQAIKLDSDSFEVHLKRADTFFALERFPEAIAEANETLKRDAKNANAFYVRSSAYTEQKKYKQALSDIDQALLYSPNLSNARMKRAQLLQIMGKTEAAVEDYHLAEKVAGGDTERPTIFLQSAESFRRKGDRVRERAELTRLISAYKNLADGYRLRGDSFYKDGKFREAAADYQQALKIEPDDEHCAQFLKSSLAKKH